MRETGGHVSLTRRTTEKKRHLTVSDGLLGQIIVDDEGVLAVVTEPAHIVSVRYCERCGCVKDEKS